MARYINCAIDHGSCNSAMAYMQNGNVVLVKPDARSETMPSWIYISRTGEVLVGAEARYQMLMEDTGEGSGVTNYKTSIGQDRVYTFEPSKQQRTAVQLASMVIRALLDAHQRQAKRRADACVITIPAMFEASAREATAEAATAAGLQYFELLQEPVAAAMAYGFEANDPKAKWIIFDMGAGTLDVSLVVVKDRRLTVPPNGNHGNTRLGGSNLDEVLMEFVLGPAKEDKEYEQIMARYRQLDPEYNPLRKQYQLDHFTRQGHSSAWGRLLLAVEEAKIMLSSRREARVEVPGTLCKDGAGRDVRVDITVTRDAYQKLIEPFVEQACTCVDQLLANNRLTPAEIDQLVLVGGPSKTPYLQQVLQDRYGIALNYTIDPMTVVARGAAQYARTQEIPGGPDEEAQDRLMINCGRTSDLPTAIMSGTVLGEIPPGGRIRVRRKDGQFTSLPMPVGPNGFFEVELELVDNGRPTDSEFVTELLDGSGGVLHSIEAPVVLFPAVDATSTLPRTLLIANYQGLVDPLLRRGTQLPSSGSGSFRTTKPLHKGRKDSELTFPFLDEVIHYLGGVDTFAGHHLPVGEVRVTGDDARVIADVPEGAEVIVTVRVDKSTLVHATIAFTNPSMSFDATFERKPFNTTADEVRSAIAPSRFQYHVARRRQKERGLPAVGEALESLERQQVLPQLEAELARAAQGDEGALQKSLEMGLRFIGAVNAVKDLQRPVVIEELLDRLKFLADRLQRENLLVTLADSAQRELAAVRMDYDAHGRRQASPESQASILARLEAVEHEIYKEQVWLVEQDWFSFPDNFRGTTEALNCFKEAQELFHKDILSHDDRHEEYPTDLVVRCIRVHERLNSLWPELSEWRKNGGVERWIGFRFGGRGIVIGDRK